MRSPWIIQAGPKSDDTYPYKRHIKQRHRESRVKEVETEIMWSQSREYLELTEFRQSKNEFSTERFEAIPNKMPDFPVGKESTVNAGDIGHGFDPWRRAWQPTLVFLPGDSHGQRSLGATGHGVTKSHDWATEHMTTWLETWVHASHWALIIKWPCKPATMCLYQDSWDCY